MSDFQTALNNSREMGMKLLTEQDGWKVAKSKDDAKVEFKPSPTLNCNILRLTAYAPVSMKNAVATYLFLWNNKRTEWDTDTNKIKLLKQPTETQAFQVIYLNSLALGMISPREFVVVSDMEEKEDETIYWGCSVDMPELPVSNGHVRGFAGFFCLKMDKDPERPGFLRLMYLGEFDFKGQLPRSLADSTSPGLLLSSTDAWKKYLAKNGMLSS